VRREALVNDAMKEALVNDAKKGALVNDARKGALVNDAKKGALVNDARKEAVGGAAQSLVAALRDGKQKESIDPGVRVAEGAARAEKKGQVVNLVVHAHAPAPALDVSVPAVVHSLTTTPCLDASLCKGRWLIWPSFNYILSVSSLCTDKLSLYFMGS